MNNMTDNLKIEEFDVYNGPDALKVPATSPMALQLSLRMVKQCLDKKDTKFPQVIHTFYDTVQTNCFENLCLRQKIKTKLESIKTNLTAKKTKNEFIHFAKPANTIFVVGTSHTIEKSLQDKIAANIKTIREQAAKDIQDSILRSVQETLDSAQVSSFDHLEESKIFARAEWIKANGGAGKENLLDTLVKMSLRQINMEDTIDLEDQDADTAAGAARLTPARNRIEWKNLSYSFKDAIFSIALYQAQLKHTQLMAEQQIIAAEKERKKREAEELKTAAQAAAAARPSSSTEQSILDQVTKMLDDRLKRMENQIKKLSSSKGNHSAAGVTQTQQRQQSANTQRQGRGSGGDRGGPGSAPERNAPRAGRDGSNPANPNRNTPRAGRGGQNGDPQRPATPATNTTTTQRREGRPGRSTSRPSRGQRSSSSPHPRQPSRSPPPSSRGSSATRDRHSTNGGRGGPNRGGRGGRAGPGSRGGRGRGGGGRGRSPGPSRT